MLSTSYRNRLIGLVTGQDEVDPARIPVDQGAEALHGAAAHPVDKTLDEAPVQVAHEVGTLLGQLAERAVGEGHRGGIALAGRSCLAAVEARMAALGFDPAVAAEEGVASVAFAHCPFRELAERRPDLVCNLHRGLVEGLVDGVGGGAVEGFGTLVDRDPCRVDLVLTDGTDDLDRADEPVPVAGR